MCIGLHVKYPLFLSYFNGTWIFSAYFFFSKNTQISNFTKIRPVAAALFHADWRTDRRTDMTKLIVAFRNLRKRLKTESQRRNQQTKSDGDIKTNTKMSIFFPPVNQTFRYQVDSEYWQYWHYTFSHRPFRKVNFGKIF